MYFGPPAYTHAQRDRPVKAALIAAGLLALLS
ncbi:hypothetical protein AHiyo6_22640, partial [Arthrobacter sp. Hiyo6]